MKCNSCQEEIPPTWSYAVVKNFCPKCGGTLMDESTQELMENLTSCMEKMSDPIAIVSWLMSNYTLKKIGEYEPVVTKQNNKDNKVVTRVEPEAKYNSIIEHIHKTSGLDKSKKLSSKQVIEERGGASAHKESLVTMGPETEDDMDSSNDVDPFTDEIDDMMMPMTSLPSSNKSLQSVVQEIKMKQSIAKDNILSGSPAKNSFSRSS
jgi:predicted RNA-binding Zn-ribbon protein involved in translation (DUF1610 family)